MVRPSTPEEWREAIYAMLTIGVLTAAVLAIIGSRL